MLDDLLGSLEPSVPDPVLEERVRALRWHHSIDLGGGLITPGLSELTLGDDQLPDFADKSVLDIGAWDGYYSFLAEARGAKRVVALDHYAWGADLAARNAYWVACAVEGKLPDHGRDTTDFWDPAMAGKAPFDLAKEALGSKVEAVVSDFASMDLSELGTFDVVLFLGVLYHLRDPLGAMCRLHQVTAGIAVVETEALHLEGFDHSSLLSFSAGGTGVDGHDFGNWYVPTIEALDQLCRAGGFSRTVVIAGPPPPKGPPATPEPGRWSKWPRREPASPSLSCPPRSAPSAYYRAVVHAFA